MKKLKDHSYSFKQKVASLFLLCLFILLGIATIFLKSDSHVFSSFSKNFFISELTGNTLNMHYTIASPASYGINSYAALLPSYSKENRASSMEELTNSLELLHSVDADKLNRKEEYTYQLLLPYLENEKNGMLLGYYDNPLSPSSGMQSQLPILLAEYTFRNKRDVKDYLSLLDQTDTYFEGIATYLKEQSAAGLFMPDYSVSKVVNQCDTIMDAKSLADGSHFLNTTFEERLDSLLAAGMITEKEKASYLSENARLLTTVMLPAYKKLGDDLLLLQGSGKNQNGLYYHPKGREYYLYLLKSNTGSYRDIEDIKLLLFDNFNSTFESLRTLMQSSTELVLTQNTEVDAFAYEVPGDMLTNLQQMMKEDFPALSEVATDQSLPVCKVKSISKNLEQYCSPAFYLTPPLDDIHENVIYINQKNNPKGVDLYTTLAHEGYPGHLYQTVYSQLYFNKTNVNPVRSLLSYGGYVEGWAMYVELESYNYAKALMKDALPESESLYESYKLDRQIQLCLYSLLDIAIHYEGATYPQVHKMLASIGIANASTTRAIFEYITEEPTTYLKYYLGYLEILQLKKEAVRLWGSTYNDRRFHQFYLENGPSDFTNLRMQLKKTRNQVSYQ